MKNARYKAYLFISELNWIVFSVIRYGPAGVTLSARETLTACASSDCLQKIQKPCAFIWSEGLYDFIPECIDLSEALGWSEFCTVISCADSVLRPQSFYFANSRFSPSHITTSILQTWFLRANSWRHSVAGCYLSVGLKKTLHWPTLLTSCSPKQGEGYRWKHCHSQDMLSCSICAILSGLFIYTASDRHL